jgi:membrane peptidoglycan carboxypeptidase
MWHDFMVQAVKGVEATDFTEPAPIESLADRAQREQRGGFDLGGKRDGSGLPDEGPYYTTPPRPAATEPTTTTTTEPPATTTTTVPPTTTTKPPGTTTTTKKGSPTTTTTRPRALGDR